MTAMQLKEMYRDSDMDGLPDRIDSAPTIPQYFYRNIEPYQVEYLRDFFGHWYEIGNGIVRVHLEHKNDLQDALDAAEVLERQYDKVDNSP